MKPALSGWRQIALTGSVQVSDLAVCAGSWYAVGALVAGASGADTGPDADRQPAAWSSSDGLRWSVLPTTPRSVYGRVSRLYAVACRPTRRVMPQPSVSAPNRGPEMAALGAAIGGVHGNPRTAAWALSGGSLRELPAPFELFGGPAALSVDRLAGGPAGWLIAGGWVTAGRGGAAAWRTTTASYVPATTPGTLASSAGEQTVASDAAPLAAGWLVGGATTVLTGVRAGQRRPLAWRSTPAGWVRERLPVGSDPDADAVVDRLAAASDGSVFAVGTVLASDSAAGRFVLWRRENGRWGSPVTIDSTRPAKSVVPAVRSLAVSGRTIVVAAGDGARLRIWLSTDAGQGWREIGLPAGVATRDDGAARLAVAVDGRRLVVAAGSGDRGGLWSTSLLV